jgi:drug/metabolite transporter (DMT)-like permease
LQRILSSPAILLVLVGGALGLNFPLGKIAREAGVASLLWAALIALGAAVVLGVAHLLRRGAMPVEPRYLRYFAVTALVSYAFPNTALLAALPHLGSGLTAIFYTLSPMLTVILSRLAGLKAPSRVEYAGVGFGFVGALLVASARGELGRPAEWLWVALGLLVPFSLAVGNVYRSLDWPKDADPTWLAIGSTGAAALMLIALAVVTGDITDASVLLLIPTVVSAQVAATAVVFFFYFHLQRVGGPVTLSQMGIMAAAVATVIGALAFDERYPAAVWMGVALIAVGLGLTVWARRRV